MNNKLLQYIEDHPALNKSQLAKSLGMKPSFFNEKLEEKHNRKFDLNFCILLAEELCKYGLQINGEIFYIEKEIPLCIFSYSFKRNTDGEFEQETIDKGNSFEYKVTLYRNFYDAMDFWIFVTNQ